MFDETLRELARLGRGWKITIDMPLDEEGYFDRHCPSQDCHAEFKVMFEDWEEKVRNEIVYCPICRHEADSGEWDTPEQLEYIDQVSLAHIDNRIGNALQKDAKNFNRRQPRQEFLKISMSYKPGKPTIIIPIEAAESMRHKFVCSACVCKYSSTGAAYFCPACGNNSVLKEFDASIQTVTRTVQSMASIRGAVSRAFGRDEADGASRLILENSLVTIVSVFQLFAEENFKSLPNSSDFQYRKNTFQNIFESSTLWHDATGKRYEDMVSCDELDEIRVFFQQRHIVAHKNGLVDQDYIDKSGDRTYAVGQRIAITEDGILRLADIISKLANELKAISFPKT